MTNFVNFSIVSIPTPKSPPHFMEMGHQMRFTPPLQCLEKGAGGEE